MPSWRLQEVIRDLAYDVYVGDSKIGRIQQQVRGHNTPTGKWRHDKQAPRARSWGTWRACLQSLLEATVDSNTY